MFEMKTLSVLLMVILIVSGLVLVACEAPTAIKPPVGQPEQPAAPPSQTQQPTTPPPQQTQPTTPPAKQLSYEAKTYTNDKYGFSVQYPKDWVPRNELVNEIVVAAFGVSAAIPGMSISVADANAPLNADWIVAQTNSLPDTSKGKVISFEPTTLSDGTSAFKYVLTYNYQAFEIKSFGVAADKDGKRIRAWVWTIDAFSPYNEALFSEIAHTLSFKK